MDASKSNETGVWDNHNRGSMGEFLKGKILGGSELSFVSAYFTIYAYAALKESLDTIDHLRFMFGEPRFVQSLDPDKTEKKNFRIENDTLELENRLEQKRISRECADWLIEKVEIKSIIKPGFLHGKMYHMNNSGVQEAIIGSSNFTVRGLGLGKSENNIELNLEVDSTRDRKELKKWFDEVWDDDSLVEDVKEEVLSYLSLLYQNHSPEFIYFKTLYHVFEDYLSEASKGNLLDEKTGLFESVVWNMLYEFQKDGVKAAINKVLKHRGCIIADSVGLGKTFEALGVIKYFEKLNHKVLVLCPKKLEDNWLVFRNNDIRNPLFKDGFDYDVRAHTDLGLDKFATVNWGNYGLVVIDESHNFRNNARGVERDGIKKVTRYEFLMDQILNSGVETRVLLLSATPVNTNLKDLRNQLLLITHDKDAAFSESLGLSSIAQVMKNAQTHFSRWADPKKNPSRKVTSLLDVLDSSFFKLLDELTIARSRKHIISYYGTEEIGEFPKRLKPKALYPETDLKGYFPSYDELHEEISKYKLTIFNPTAYLKDNYLRSRGDDTAATEVFDQKTREFSLIGMMRINYLKRLESSIHSFEVSIERTIEKIESLLKKIDNFEENLDYAAPGLFPDPDEEEAELLERLRVGNKLHLKLEDIDRDGWRKDLKKDRKQLISIHEKAAAVTPERDAKLQELKHLIMEKISNPINDDNKKILIFTAFADTAHYLYENLQDWIFGEFGLYCALVSGKGENKTTFRPAGFKHQTDFISILTNFSPKSKLRNKMSIMPQIGEIDILIATDCISEGQNLQDCDYLINYDIHWNPVRIIQRFGRIDRLGSENKQIQLVNFWPTNDLNKYLNLKDRVEARMAMVDLAATAGDNLLDQDQLEALVAEELTYREKQLIRLKDEVIDLEEMDDNISLGEFTLDDFRIELLNFLDGNRKQLEEAPFGLYAVTPSLHATGEKNDSESSWKEIAKPGIIFCLRHKHESKDTRSSKVNPLGRYYLLYIRDDGTVRFTFTHSKKILTMFQKLCTGRNTPHQELCDLFDRETCNGENMEKYGELLTKAVKTIASTFRIRAAAGLQTGRDFIIPDRQKQASENSDFDLVTWLVIKGS